MRACLTGDYDTLSELLSQNHREGSYSAIICCSLNNSALMYAVTITGYYNVNRNQKIRCIQLLLQNKRLCPINHQGYFGMTALHVAVYNDFEEAVLLLLSEEDIDVSIADHNGITALELAEKLQYRRIADAIRQSDLFVDR